MICKFFPDKIQYSTYYKAQKHLSSFNRGRNYKTRKNNKNNLKTIYKCDSCGMYHTSSKLKK